MRVRAMMLAVLLVLLLCGACAPMMPPAGILYSGVQSNRQFEPGATSDAAGRLVYGEACAHGVLFLASWGDASLDAAFEKANALGRTLKNVTIDHSHTNIFIFYQQYCTIVKAYVVDKRDEPPTALPMGAAEGASTAQPAPDVVNAGMSGTGN